MYEMLGLQALGEALIVNTLSNAYYALTKHPIYKRADRYVNGSDCLAFIKSEEFDLTIKMYGLNVDPHRLREMFFICVDRA